LCCDLKSVITYHSTIKRAKELRDNFFKIANEADVDLEGNFFIEHINGTYPAKKRSEILDRLKKLEQDEGGDCHRRFRV